MSSPVQMAKRIYGVLQGGELEFDQKEFKRTTALKMRYRKTAEELMA